MLTVRRHDLMKLPWSLICSTFLVLVGTRCNGFSTEKLLNLEFVQGDTYLTVETAALVNSGQTFVVTVTARKRNINILDHNFASNLSVSASGTGTLTVGQIEPWSRGKARMSVSYATLADVGNLDSIVLQVQARGLSGTSNKITVYNEPTLHHFAVAIPATATVNTAFNVTITAKDVNGNTVTSFNTPNDAGVLITPSCASGTLTVTSPASGFVNGILTLSAAYNVGVNALKVRVVLQSDAAIKGESGPLTIPPAAQATVANFRVMAIPITNNLIRLTWMKIPEAFDVIIEEEQTPGNFTQIATISGSLNYHYHTVTASSSHTYRVTVRNNAAATLLQGTASASTYSDACITTIAATTYTTNQSWTVAASPYCITGSVIFDSGARLDIERGALILMSSAGKLTFRNAAAFLPADTGSGMTRITSISDASPPVPHLGVALESTASPTAYAGATDDYANGSVLRHIYYEYGAEFRSDVNLKVDDVFFRQNLNRALTVYGPTKTVVTNATFQNNTGSGGGGMEGVPGVTSVSAATFEYNTSNAPQGWVHGGGLRNCNQVTNSFFIGNSSSQGGGGVGSCNSVIDSCFVKNYAVTFGGGQAEGVALRNYYSENSVSGNGGAIWTYSIGANVITHSYFENNATAGNGGAVFLYSNGSGLQTKGLRYNWYRGNSATGQGAAVFVDTTNTAGSAIAFTSLQEYYLDNATGTSALYVRQNRDATDTDNDIATIINGVFKKAATDLESAANISFVLTGTPTPVGVSNGTINNSYFETGAADCTAAFITGATSSCTTPTPNLFKTDVQWPFCASTAPGQATPANCVGPSWDKPVP